MSLTYIPFLPDTEEGEDGDNDPLMRTPPPTDDELLALILIATWASRTGRLLPADVPPHDLTEQELIDFWVDDQLPTDHHAAARGTYSMAARRSR
ncbi:hypothetical protein ACRYCC_31190 [Actinomadura scrupuli]|uniref:hypothetical protein n=1 Tax=Actinomadura scrupuli TaxID=559629 RepID=UPI003D994554